MSREVFCELWKRCTAAVMSTQVWCKPFKLAITSLLTNSVDIEPDNILVNNDSASDRFSDVQLDDCEDTFMIDSKASPFEEITSSKQQYFAALRQC
jgi:hypothetical protein